jgi:hypothetical protein
MLKRPLLRDLALISAAAAIGWWAHAPHPAVHAAESAEFPFFQFSNVAGEGTLTLYNSNDHILYVYGGVLSGSSHKQCTYAIKLGHAGAPLDRSNCAIGSLF